MLKNQHAELEKNLKTAKPDEARELKVQIAQNAGAQRDVTRAIEDSEDAREREAHAAEVGVQIIEAEKGHHQEIAKKLKEKLDFEEKIAAARKANNQPLVQQLQAQQQAGSNTAATAYSKSNSEGAKGTLQDLADNAPLIGGAGGKAREVLRLEAHARELGRNAREGHPEDLEAASKELDKAKQLRQTIPNLKDSEKSSELKAALDEAQVLKNIDSNTKGIRANR